MTHVIDTSVIIKWFVDEGDNAAAIRYIGEPLVAPELVLAEVGNAIWKKWRKGEIAAEQVYMVNTFVTSFVEIFSIAHVAEAAINIALELNHPVYDCYFLATAEELDTQLLTFDRRLTLACENTRLASRINYLGA